MKMHNSLYETMYNNNVYLVLYKKYIITTNILLHMKMYLSLYKKVYVSLYETMYIDNIYLLLYKKVYNNK